MEMDTYQTATDETAIYPGRLSLNGLLYTTIGLAGEMGEFANIVKKVLRDGATDEKREKLKDELGDVLWYITRCAVELGLSLEEVADHNIQKLRARKANGTINASKDGTR
jgi:NTP pyrophosphatase (non-canonical NTP hydrolase)